MRAIPLLMLITSPLVAQFWDLAATDDGRQLYFTSSLVLTGSAAQPPASPNPSFLYRIDPGGVRLVAEKATTPRISGDGQVVGYVDPTFCTARPVPASCVEAMLLGPPKADLGTGDLALSRNGRWALVSNVSADANAPPANSTLIDLSTGARTPVPPRPADPRPFIQIPSVASNGSLLVQATGETGESFLALWHAGELTRIASFPEGSQIQPLALSDDAEAFLYSVRDPAARLIVHNIRAGTGKILFTAPAGSPAIYFMGASRDFGTILFRPGFPGSPGPLYLADTASAQSVLIPLPGGELVSDGTLSGSGEAAFLVTSRGRMLKVALAAGRSTMVDEIIGPTAFLSSAGSRPITVFPVAPGQVVRLWGLPDAPATFWENRILFDGRSAAVAGASGGAVDLQVPWEVPVGLRDFRLQLPPGNSPFEQSQPVYINSAVPSFAGAPGGFLGLAMALGDFSGLVTTPPAPADIVHLYLTGLGAVIDPPPLGRPAPTDRLFPLRGTLKCLFIPLITPAETLFAGLAPGMLGFYQVDLRMPLERAMKPIDGIACTLANQQPYGIWQFAYRAGQNCVADIRYP